MVSLTGRGTPSKRYETSSLMESVDACSDWLICKVRSVYEFNSRVQTALLESPSPGGHNLSRSWSSMPWLIHSLRANSHSTNRAYRFGSSEHYCNLGELIGLRQTCRIENNAISQRLSIYEIDASLSFYNNSLCIILGGNRFESKAELQQRRLTIIPRTDQPK